MMAKEHVILRMSEKRWLVCERALSADYCNVVGETGDSEGGHGSPPRPRPDVEGA